MRTLIIILGGLVVLGVFCLIGKMLSQDPAVVARAAVYFLPVWVVAAALNMWMGVRGAGYSVSEELPIFALIFAIPGIVAGFLWWRFSHA